MDWLKLSKFMEKILEKKLSINRIVKNKIVIIIILKIIIFLGILNFSLDAILVI